MLLVSAQRALQSGQAVLMLLVSVLVPLRVLVLLVSASKPHRQGSYHCAELGHC